MKATILCLQLIFGLLNYEVRGGAKISNENYNIRYLQTRYLDSTQTTTTFKIAVFSDLMYGKNSTLNTLTQQFCNQTLFHYNSTSGGIDLAIILGNAVDGTQWDGIDNNYFQDRWDLVMQPFVLYGVKVAFTFGDRDTLANLKHTDDIIEYLYSYSNLAITYIAP